jgi:xanthine dehydrogenase accessory factor
MRDVMQDIDRWQGEGKAIALATVVQTWGSSPRAAGAKMALTPHHDISGSVSGGCVEGAVYEEGAQALNLNRPKLLHFGVADETAWEVGLACGGSIDVFVQPLDAEIYKTIRTALLDNQPFATVTVIAGNAGSALVLYADGSVVGSTGAAWEAPALAAARVALNDGQSRRQKLGSETEIFIEVTLPPPTLIIVGGVHIAIALTALAKTLGYHTIVVDPRAAFGSEARFPHADKLIQAWPDEALAQIPLTRSTAVAMLTHDPKLDDPALKLALPSEAFYVGALGSPSTQAKRRARLLDEGLTESQINRLYGPIGLDLGGRTPEEIALAVMGQVVAARNGRGKP